MRGDKGARMANAMAVVAGRAARSCDVCARKRSRWYCAADEAYLCEECDSSVHAANALAFRHERVRLTANGAPMKMDRRSNVNHGDMPHHSAPTTTNKKKAKAHRPGSNSTPSAAGAAPFQPLQQTEKYNLGENNRGLREVKLELTPGNCGANDTDASDDHFTAEELTGNANLLDDPSSMCPPTYDGSANGDYSHGMAHGEGDFAHDFLVSDPNDPHSNSHRGGSGTPSSDILTSSSVGGGDGMDQYEDEEDEEDGDCVGNEWMDLANRDLTGDDDYCIDPTALRDSISAPDQVIPHYSHDEKPDLHGDGGFSPSFHGKAFKNSWAKPEGGGYGNYGFAPHQQQQALNGSACKVEGLPMSGGDLRLVPTLRLNYEDVLSSWPNRGMMWTDDGSGSQLVPDDSNSDMGSCYDLGLVPDLSSGGCGVDGSGHLASMYGCGSGGVGGCGMGEDGMISAGNAREARVSRYREKRRTRLFSKKIRYEVRKLNAERRPRMKGRFVKRSPGRDS